MIAWRMVAVMASRATAASSTVGTISPAAARLTERCPQTSLLKFRFMSTGHNSTASEKRRRDAESAEAQRRATRNSLYYAISMGVVAIGVTFAAIPAYRIFCETTSFGGTTQVAKDYEKIENMEKVKSRLIQVQFNADMPSSMQWNFKPLQNEIYVHPGETALAFFTAKNPTDRPIVGISSYNLTPFQAAYYFHKIQCFCFEEQILNPGEEVDLPVFFYIDPDFANDPALEYMDQMLLSYTFFESKQDLQLPSPFDPSNRPINRQLPPKPESAVRSGESTVSSGPTATLSING